MAERGQHGTTAGIPRSVQVRLFLTCWLVYLVHFSPFVVRELYLVMSLAEKGSVRVDEYVDLHPDLFTMAGRGSYLGNNPGAAFVAAVPYWLALPVINRVAPVRPHPQEEAASAQYNEQRRNRLAFYRKVRERGIDVRLAVGALITSGFCMAPLAALSAVLMMRVFGWLGFSGRAALWMALLYALGTPVFFRAGTLSLNLMVTLLGLFAFVLMWWPSGAHPEREKWRTFAAGALASWCVVTDYTGVVTVGMLGLFAVVQQMRGSTLGAALRGRVWWYVAGGIGPLVFLLGYQWYCFGNPWIPAQFHMPKIYYMGYPSERGFGWPLPEALWGLLFDPLYGLLVFAPVFALALYHPALVKQGRNRVPARVAVFAWAFFAALYLFSSCIHYTVRHQWQDGVRYVVPAVPFLFLLVADVLSQAKRWVAFAVMAAAMFETWCLSMVRENPLESISRVAQYGFQFPWLTTLKNAATQYFPPLADEASAWSRWLPVGVVGAMLAGIALIWLVRWPARAARVEMALEKGS